MSVQTHDGVAIYVPVMAERPVFYYFTFKVFLSQPLKLLKKKKKKKKRATASFLKKKKTLLQSLGFETARGRLK